MGLSSNVATQSRSLACGDGWATGVKLAETFEQWEAGEANSSTIQGDSKTKAFPLVCVCLPQHWCRTIEGEPIKS